MAGGDRGANCWQELDLVSFPESECVDVEEAKRANAPDTCWYFDCGETHMPRSDKTMEKGSSLEECCFAIEAFTLGNLGAAICPEGTGPIRDQDQCHRASKRLHLPESWFKEQDDIPDDAACYVDTSETTKEEMGMWAEGKTSMMARGGDKSRLLCNDTQESHIRTASMGGMTRSILGDGSGGIPGGNVQVKAAAAKRPNTLAGMMGEAASAYKELEAMCPTTEAKAPECSCSFIGSGTDVRVGALCYVGDVCYNMVHSWCAEDEAVCMTT